MSAEVPHSPQVSHFAQMFDRSVITARTPCHSSWRASPKLNYDYYTTTSWLLVAQQDFLEFPICSQFVTIVSLIHFMPVKASRHVTAINATNTVPLTTFTLALRQNQTGM